MSCNQSAAGAQPARADASSGGYEEGHLHANPYNEWPITRDAEGGGFGGGSNDNNGAGSDGAAGGFADAGNASASFDSSISANAGGDGSSGPDYGAGGPSFGNGGDSNGGGISASSGLSSNAFGAGPVSLTGSEPGPDFGAAAKGVASTIAGLGVLAMGNPFGAVIALVNAGATYDQAVAATKAAIGYAYAVQEQQIADAQMSAFSQ